MSHRDECKPFILPYPKYEILLYGVHIVHIVHIAYFCILPYSGILVSFIVDFVRQDTNFQARRTRKQWASEFSRSLCETFAFATSETVSIHSGNRLIQTVGNVSIFTYLSYFAYCTYNSYISHKSFLTGFIWSRWYWFQYFSYYGQNNRRSNASRSGWRHKEKDQNRS